MLLSKATYNQYIGQKKKKKYIAVRTVGMFIEPSSMTSSADYNQPVRCPI